MKHAGRCPYCGRDMRHPGPMGRSGPSTRSRDHIRPQQWGGNDDADNIRIVCRTCNELRAMAGHCLGALACARAVAQGHPLITLSRWRLPNLAFAAILTTTWPGGQVTTDPVLTMKDCVVASRAFTQNPTLPFVKGGVAVQSQCTETRTPEAAGFAPGWDQGIDKVRRKR